MPYTHVFAQFDVVPVADSTDDLRELIYDVLYRDFSVPRNVNWLHLEEGGTLIVARNRWGLPLGLVRLMPVDPARPLDRQIRQVVVSHAAQGRGVGAALVCEAERIALEDGAVSLWLHSRASAYGFYEAAGFEASGEEFASVLTKLPHRFMTKRIRQGAGVRALASNHAPACASIRGLARLTLRSRP